MARSGGWWTRSKPRCPDASEHCVVPAVEALGRRHVAYGAEAGHYDTVGDALPDTLRATLGDDFGFEVEEAWATAYRTLAAVMQRGS